MGKHALAAACLTALTLTACEPSTDCADPTLLTSSSTFGSEETSVHLWEPDGRQERLGTGPVLGPARLSPDGELVAFVQPLGEFDEEYGWDDMRIAVYSIATGKLTPLTDAVGDRRSLDSVHWSGDGSEVAYVRTDNTGPGEAVQEIVAVGVDGTGERTLLELDWPRQESGFAWSADGEELLVPTAPEHVAGPGEIAEQTELWRYSVDTGQHEVVPTPHQRIGSVTWSPDERLVAMNATTIEPGSSGTPRLYVFDLEEGATTAVDRRRGGPTATLWSGPYLVYGYTVWGPGQVEDHQLVRWDSRTGDREQIDRPGLDDLLLRTDLASGGLAISAAPCS